MTGEYFSIEDPRDLDGEPDDTRCEECLQAESTRMLRGRELCQACYDDLADPTPWCAGCGSMTQKGCDCGPIADNN